jgi:hypothetical protein
MVEGGAVADLGAVIYGYEGGTIFIMHTYAWRAGASGPSDAALPIKQAVNEIGLAPCFSSQ